MRALPKGVYDEIITASLRLRLLELPPVLRADTVELSSHDAIEYVVRKVADRTREHLKKQLDGESTSDSILLANRILDTLDPSDPVEGVLLQQIRDSYVTSNISPIIPLAQSAFITNDLSLNYYAVLKSELSSADKVDFICPFIGNQGLNLIHENLTRFGSNLRVITSTYLGATDQRAIQRLAEIGAQIKIVYERADQKTSLHAKSWIFHRESGFSTATIGSSNLSSRALVDGLEWNVRLSVKDAPQVINELWITFERLWQESKFEIYEDGRDRTRLSQALRSQRTGTSVPNSFFNLEPLSHQKEALEELEFARLEGKSENLIVAATGTGKTLLAAFDYQRFCRKQGGRPRLLFVAHRKDILDQSLAAFRAVMRDGRFGEKFVADERPIDWDHVFASVQSLSHRRITEIDPKHFDYIVIDEFHHAEAPTYQRLLNHFVPLQLVGLTATPERSDGTNVIDRFGKATYELRIWHALDRNLLCPFHYFGIDDQTDLRDVAWIAGKYSGDDLDQIYVVGGNRRAEIIISELIDKAEDLEEMKVVAFCSSIRHAEFMSERFKSAGFSAVALHSGIQRDDRETMVQKFRQGQISILCTVDLFNEGVDIPEINTVLFLRPTESPTIFIQQLGRGLRTAIDKGALTVLDFVGHQNKKFRFDLRFSAMTGMSRMALTSAVRDGFPNLPAGCHIHLDKVTEKHVLRNLKESIPSNRNAIIAELRRMQSAGIPITLRSFLSETGIGVADIYRLGSFRLLLSAAGVGTTTTENTKRAGGFLHVDDRRRIEQYRLALTGRECEEIWSRMLAFPLTRSIDLANLDLEVAEEALDLFSCLELQAISRPLVANDLPFALHCHYNRDEIVAPFRDNPESMRQGTFYVQNKGLDIHLFTLRKTERAFSPTTRYADYFISSKMIHWESQSTTSVASPTGQRLTTGEGRHLFFVREDKVQDGRAAPFFCLGFGHPISFTGDRPIELVWELDHEVPDHRYIGLRAAAG